MHLGKEVIDVLNEVEVGPDSVPFARVSIMRCGPTNARGDHEELDGGGSGPMTTADAVARIKQESATARSAVLEALQMGMGSSSGGGSGGYVQGAAAAGAKRKADDTAGPSGTGKQVASESDAGAAKKAARAAEKPTAGKPSEGASKSRALDAVLGDLSDDDSDSADGS